ncbi:hypothetical protein KI659_05435 [Litoribacter alkaliphilus]|uniref:Lipocalin-like domain-containing protein n=1 Tax=Litoribacter ruber TaxID=702568 RepID=A0AAP2G0U2_9BACT|nr:hypothetical protein [Litoribacter alkaliphilus]MBS9523459.1 hypothetical protein [Litoribacter alkaliphilus]
MKAFTLLLLLIIDPTLILGEWKIVSYPAYEKLISSPRTGDLDPDDYLKSLDIYNLYMDSTYYLFTKDTLYFTDMKEGSIVPKIGKWHLDKDTLVINDYKKIATYRYLIVKLDNEELLLKGILENGIVAKTPRTFKRANEN